MPPITYVMQPLESMTYAQTIEILHYAPRHAFDLEIVDTRTSNSYSVIQLVQLVSNVFSFLEDRDVNSPD